MRIENAASEFTEDLAIEKKEADNSKVSLEEGGFVDKLDGGYGWWIVLASFFMQACSFGITSGFGVFLNHYQSHVFPGQPKSKISLIGTVAPTTIALGSVFSGILCDKLGFRVCTIMGLVLAVISFLTASFSTEIWHLIVTQGFLFGLGGALLYIPANTIVTKWFIKHRGLAVGIGTAGTGFGGSIASVVNGQLLSNLSVPWVLRINGIVVGIILLVSSIIIKTPRNTIFGNNSQSSQPEPFKLSIILNGKFILFFTSMIFVGFGLLVPLYYIPSYAKYVGLSDDQGAFLAGAVNISSAIGRIVLGFMGDRLGHIRIFLICLISACLLLIIWLFSKTFVLLMFFSIVYGLAYGGFTGGFPSTTAALFGEKHLATIMGIAYTATCIGDLLGPYFGGLIVDGTHDYQYVIYYAMGLYGASALFFIITLILYSKK